MIETQRLKDTKEVTENPLSYKIIGAAIEVHRTLGGPGLLEGIYESALCYELSLQGLKVQLLTYLRLTGLRLGLVINFGAKHVKEGIKRVING